MSYSIFFMVSLMANASMVHAAPESDVTEEEMEAALRDVSQVVGQLSRQEMLDSAQLDEAFQDFELKNAEVISVPYEVERQ